MGGDLGAPPEPDGSGQGYRNRYEVRRTEGSSAVAETPEARTGIVYDESMELNLASDDVLDGHAWWRLHLASYQGLRWPRLELNLAARPEYIDDWLACRVGSRIQVLNPPEDVAGQDIDLMLQGWTVTLGHKEFRVTANCSPAQPWLVAEVDGDQRVAAEGSTLATAITATSTTLLIASTGGVVWTTDPADFPLDIAVGGERITLSAITGSSSPQTATVAARAVNGVTKAHSAGAPVDVWQPAITAL